jgi:hypothetical protein
MEAAAAIPVRSDHGGPHDDFRTGHFIEQLLGAGQVRATGRVTCKEGVADVEVAPEAGPEHLGMHVPEVAKGGEVGEHEGADAEAEEVAVERERGASREGAEEGVEDKDVWPQEGGEEGERRAVVTEAAAREEECRDNSVAEEDRVAEDRRCRRGGARGPRRRCRC